MLRKMESTPTLVIFISIRATAASTEAAVTPEAGLVPMVMVQDTVGLPNWTADK